MNPSTAPAAALPAEIVTPLDAAMARLAASRARLRSELSPPIEPGAGGLDAQGQAQADVWPRSLAAWWRRGRRALRAWPVADLAAGLLQDWWQRHPWRSTGEELAEAAREAVLPLVRRHPLSALLVAAALGAALVAARGRWPAPRPARPAARQRVGRWLAAQLANPAVQTALLSTVMLIVKQLSTPQSAPRAPPAAPGPPGPPTPSAHSASTPPL